MVRRAVGRGTEKLLDLLEISAMWNRENFLGIATSRLVVRRRPGNCAFAGCAQSRRRSADECSGARGRQLEMALYERTVVGCRVSRTPGADEKRNSYGHPLDAPRKKLVEPRYATQPSRFSRRCRQYAAGQRPHPG